MKEKGQEEEEQAGRLLSFREEPSETGEGVS